MYRLGRVRSGLDRGGEDGDADLRVGYKPVDAQPKPTASRLV
jgi:hypothetical protein